VGPEPEPPESEPPEPEPPELELAAELESTEPELELLEPEVVEGVTTGRDDVVLVRAGAAAELR
jgi:hypothetical protein